MCTDEFLTSLRLFGIVVDLLTSALVGHSLQNQLLIMCGSGW